MASEDTLIGSEFRLQIGNGDSPPTYVDACSVSDVAGLGETKTLLDVTTYCDDARTYRGGLRDGNEVTLTLNNIQNAADIESLFASWDAGTVVQLRFVKADSPTEMFLEWNMSLIGWGMTAPVGEKMSLTFTGKITGGVTREGFDAP
jgi:hypothetical protein